MTKSFIIEAPLEFNKIENSILNKSDEIINSKVTAIFNTSDISVMGYDNIVYSNLVYPRLSTVHHDMYGIGRLVVDSLIYRLETGVYKEMKQTIDPTLVVRDSVRKL